MVLFQGALAALGVDSIADFTKGAGGDILSFDLSDLSLANGTRTTATVATTLDTADNTAAIILIKGAGYADIAGAAAALAACSTTATNAVFAFWDNTDNLTRVVHTTNAGPPSGHASSIDLSIERCHFGPMYVTVLGDIADPETFATGSAIREISRPRKLYGRDS